MIGFGFTNRNILPIGLDIGHGWIKMVQLARGERLSVKAAEKARLDGSLADNPQQYRRQIVSTIEDMHAKGRFEGTDVVTSLANEELKVTSLRLAQMTEQQTEAAVRDEAKERFGLSCDQDVIRYLPVGQVKHGDELKNEFVLFAAAGDVIREHIEMLRQAHLVSVGLDAIPCALFRSFDRLFRREEDWQQTLVFVDVGQCCTTVVFGRGGEMAFVKEIAIGTQRFDEEISDKLGISPDEAQVLRAGLRAERKAGESRAEMDEDTAVFRPDFGDFGLAETQSQMTAVQTGLDVSTRQVIVDAVRAIAQELAREISLCFRYYTVTFRGKRVERAVFAGGGAYENVLLNVLRRQLTVQVEIAEPFRGLDITNVNFGTDRRGSHCEWTVAVGLALKNLD